MEGLAGGLVLVSCMAITLRWGCHGAHKIMTAGLAGVAPAHESVEEPG